MDILRRNTDYALLLMAGLAAHYGQDTVSTRQLSQNSGVPYSLACKLLQKLHSAKFVESVMGPAGGFQLTRKPQDINLLEIIELIQGKVSLNRCFLCAGACGRKDNCGVHKKLTGLQEHIEDYLKSITLTDILESSDLQNLKHEKCMEK